MFVLHGAYSVSKAAPLVSRTKLWLGFVCSFIYGYWLRVLYIAKNRIHQNLHLPFNEVSNICELSSPIMLFLQLTGMASPSLSKFVRQFFNDAQHVGRHMHIQKILHILHGITAASEEAVFQQDFTSSALIGGHERALSMQAEVTFCSSLKCSFNKAFALIYLGSGFMCWKLLTRSLAWPFVCCSKKYKRSQLLVVFISTPFSKALMSMWYFNGSLS